MDPLPIRSQLSNHMRKVVGVTYVVIDVEKLDESDMAWVEMNVERRSSRLKLTEALNVNGERISLRDGYEPEISKAFYEEQKKMGGKWKVPATTTEEKERMIDALRQQISLNLMDDEDIRNELTKSLKESKEANVQLKKDWEYEKKQANILRTERDDMKARIHELEATVICFCKAPYCFG